jgi:hypothetical protein
MCFWFLLPQEPIVELSRRSGNMNANANCGKVDTASQRLSLSDDEDDSDHETFFALSRVLSGRENIESRSSGSDSA